MPESSNLAAVSIRILGKIQQYIVNPAIRLLFAAALVFFLWGVAEFVMNEGNEKMRDQGKKHMIWGIVGLAIMVSAFGIVNLICRTIGAC